MSGVSVALHEPSSPLVGEDARGAHGGGRPASAGQKTHMPAPSAKAADGPPSQPSPTRGEGLRRLALPVGATQRARRLRRDMTDAERVLWAALREAMPA